MGGWEGGERRGAWRGGGVEPEANEGSVKYLFRYVKTRIFENSHRATRFRLP